MSTQYINDAQYFFEYRIYSAEICYLDDDINLIMLKRILHILPLANNGAKSYKNLYARPF